MPPALSDDEQSDIADLDVPMHSGPPSPGSAEDDSKAANGDIKKSGSADEGGSDEGSDEDDEEEDMFVVETIKKHMIDENGDLRFQVKWEGYDSKKDLTWEPEENLTETANEILEEYLNKIGGREAIFEETEKAAKGKKRARQSTGAKNAAPAKRTRKNGNHPVSTTPPAAAKKWSPPSGSWEDEIAYIDACEEEGTGKLVVYLNWKNGQKTKHDTKVIYKKCPQKMLQFYEQHVKIIREENKTLESKNAENADS